MDPKPIGLSPRSTLRGRPRTRSNRDDPCARCGRNIPRLAATWPEGRLCNICYFDAIHTRGTCPECLQDRLLPGPPNADGHPVCSTCAAIPYDFHCECCGVEAGHHRGRLCARCALRDDLHGLLGGEPNAPELVGLVDLLCASDRPESIIVWKRSSKVQELLRGLGDGTIRVSHEGLDSVPGKQAEHLRALLQHHGLLPQRDPYLPRFERWIDAKLDGLPAEVRQPVQHFATWHHLRRIRAKAAAGATTRGPVHSAKQEITETLKFLLWLLETYQRTAATCTQQDVDEWLATGPTTRSAIRTFFVVAKKSRMNTSVNIQHRSAKSSPSLSQDQRLAWIQELLTGSSESLPYRVAGMLLLLYAQPLVKVVTLPTSVIDDTDTGMSITLGQHPTDVPEPFASVLRAHLAARPNLRTGAGPDSPWLFPSTLAGRYIHPNTVMDRLRDLGVNLLGARNRAIGELVLECPPSLVAEALGYSAQVAFLHADKAAEPWARYAGRSIRSP
ncbi:recombinase XerD [Nocardioides agariphilus]|uniref:Recombinase XerD n=1 Tax=Nocardioides agariphilus TaxID=433664 RepID=A0A930VLV6_9ACTN|nr:recombinase XerD [Nocardioides agariphilus]MBF4767243.1 recombinase XerD [Nocardioides agariphilus]